jgi:MFS family permease
MGVFGFVAAGGGTVGVLLGGILTDLLTWHWIFLVNIPVGIAVFALCVNLLPGTRGPAGEGRLDVAGAVTVTGALMLAVYAIVNGNSNGWTSAETSGSSRQRESSSGSSSRSRRASRHRSFRSASSSTETSRSQT